MNTKSTIRLFYSLLPWKQHIYSLLKYVPLPGGLIKHLHFIGIFTVRIENKKFQMQHYGFQLENEIFWRGVFGGWERTSLKIWYALVSQSQYIFDVGANTGLFALLAKTANPYGEVYAFEPVKRVYDRMVRNFELNRFTIQCEELALSDSEGEALIYDLPSDHIYSVTVNKNTNPEGLKVMPVKVDIISLEKYFLKRNIRGLDLMKIDVETHEPEVLLGGRELIKKFRPAMIVEVLNEAAAERLDTLLKDMNYQLYFIDEGKGVVRQDAFTKGNGYGNFLICTKEHAEYLRQAVEGFK